MSEQLKDENKAATCPKCAGEMIRARAGDETLRARPLYIYPQDKSAPIENRSPSYLLVCKVCGFTELYTQNPEMLNPKRGDEEFW